MSSSIAKKSRNVSAAKKIVPPFIFIDNRFYRRDSRYVASNRPDLRLSLNKTDEGNSGNSGEQLAFVSLNS
jgi:hypothetical protein